MVRKKSGKNLSCVICKNKFYVPKSKTHFQTCGGKCRNKLSGQSLKGRIFSEEHCKNLKNRPKYCFFQKGNQYWEKRDHKKMVEKIIIAMDRPETKEKLSNSIKLKWQDKEYRKKCIESQKKKKLTPEHRENLSKSLLKNTVIRRGTCFGKKFSNEINKKKGRKGELNAMSKLEHRLKLMGSNCHLWKGGIAYEPYAPGFTNEIKKIIKEIDNYTCQECKKNSVMLNIHHIDYNKKNHSIENLISLCNKCHGKTNINREEWTQKFIELNENEREKNFMAFRQPFHHILKASSC